MMPPGRPPACWKAARGADIRNVYSPLDALAHAAKKPRQRGSSRVASRPRPPRRGNNDSALSRYRELLRAVPTSHSVPMRILSSDPELGIDGFICPAHVSAIIGAGAFRFLAREHGVPCVVTGFEPADILRGVEMLARQVSEGRATVENEYSRFVTEEGNARAKELLARVFAPADTQWRGLGPIPESGLEIREEFRDVEAEKACPFEEKNPVSRRIASAESLKGNSPICLSAFRTASTPEQPLGACMVSLGGKLRRGVQLWPIVKG